MLESRPIGSAAMSESIAPIGPSAAFTPPSMRSGETTPVGSTRTQPRPSSQISTHACASAWRTMSSRLNGFTSPPR